MKLDRNIVRDLLLEMEDKLERGMYLYINDDSPITKMGDKEYDTQSLIYAAEMLADAGFLSMRGTAFKSDKAPDGVGYSWEIGNLTYAAHELIDTIRPKTIWEQLGAIADEAGGFSLKQISDMAKALGTSYLKKKVGLD